MLFVTIKSHFASQLVVRGNITRNKRPKEDKRTTLGFSVWTWAESEGRAALSACVRAVTRTGLTHRRRMFGTSELASVLRSSETLSRMISSRASSDALNKSLSVQHNADCWNVKTTELPFVVTQFIPVTQQNAILLSSRSDVRQRAVGLN